MQLIVAFFPHASLPAPPPVHVSVGPAFLQMSPEVSLPSHIKQSPVQLVGGVSPLAVHAATSPVLGSIMVLPAGHPEDAKVHL